MPRPVIYAPDERSPAARQRRRKAQLLAAGGRFVGVALTAEAAAALDRLCLARKITVTEAIAAALIEADQHSSAC